VSAYVESAVLHALRVGGVLAFDDLGMFSYTLDAIPTFRGTVEVTEGDSMHHG